VLVELAVLGGQDRGRTEVIDVEVEGGSGRLEETRLGPRIEGSARVLLSRRCPAPARGCPAMTRIVPGVSVGLGRGLVV